MSVKERIVYGTSAVLVEKIAELFIQTIILLLLTRVFLSPEEYGLLFLSISIFSVATLFATFGIHKSMARYIAEYRDEDSGQIYNIFRFSVILIISTTLLTSILLFIFSSKIASIFNSDRLVVLLSLGPLYIVAKSSFDYIRMFFQGVGRVPLAAITGILRRTGELFFIVLFLSLGLGVVGGLWGFIVGMTTGVVFGCYCILHIIKDYPQDNQIEPGLRRRIAEYSIPLTATRSADILYKRVDTLMVGFFLSPLAVGFYELAKQIANAVQAPAASLGFAAAPTYGGYKSKENLTDAAKIYEQTFVYILLFYFPIVAGILLLSEEGIRHIFGDDYIDASPVLMIYSIFILFQAIDKITNDSLDYLGKAKHRAIGKSSTAVLNFILNILLIPTLGIEGAAISTAITFGIMSIYNIYLIKVEIPIRFRNIYFDLVKIATTTSIMSILIYLLKGYIYNTISLILVIISGIIIWVIMSFATGVLKFEDLHSAMLEKNT